MDANLLCKTLKTCNLTTIEAILMKRSSIIYLCQIFSLDKYLGRNSKGIRERKYQKIFLLISIFFQTELKNSDKDDAFTCIELLVNIL